MAKDFTFWNFFLRMSSTKLSLYNTSADPSTSIYRETSTSLICEVEPSSGTYGATPFEDYWWECRLIFQPSYENWKIFQLFTKEWRELLRVLLIIDEMKVRRVISFIL